jgi:hypothetical protein
MTRSICLSIAVAIGLAGCGGGPGRVADPVPVKGQVTLANGRPLKDVMLTLQPLDAGHMAGFKVGSDGRFTGEAVPGKYAFFFAPQESKAPAEQQKLEAALQAVPEKYKAANMDHTVTVSSSGSDLLITLQ